MPDAIPASDAPSAASTKAPSAFRRFLRFETMLTPKLIRFVFYVGSALFILAGTVVVFTGGGAPRVLGGLAMLFGGPLGLRIVCEQILVIFGIYDRLGEIRDQGA